MQMPSALPVPVHASAPTRALGAEGAAPTAARLEAVFLRALAAARSQWLAALATEPAGPARQLRAYVRSVCDHAAALAHPARHPARHPLYWRALTQALLHPDYQATWCDFVAEGCAADSVDHDLSLRCRAAAEGLWLRHAAMTAALPTALSTALPTAWPLPLPPAAGCEEDARRLPAARKGRTRRTPARHQGPEALQAAQATHAAMARAQRDYLLCLCAPACHCTVASHPPATAPATQRPAQAASH